jgi:hypothetical protein
VYCATLEYSSPVGRTYEQHTDLSYISFALAASRKQQAGRSRAITPASIWQRNVNTSKMTFQRIVSLNAFIIAATLSPESIAFNPIKNGSINSHTRSMTSLKMVSVDRRHALETFVAGFSILTGAAGSANAAANPALETFKGKCYGIMMITSGEQSLCTAVPTKYLSLPL